MPLVSIIIPVYKYERYIVDCLVSCVNQEHDDIEIIVVDDASPDRSSEMAEKVRDKRIRILGHTTNKGYSAAKNTGIRASKGKYIRTLDADDMLTPVGITKPLAFLEGNLDIPLVHGIAYKLDGGPGYGKALLKQSKLPFDTRCKIHAQGVMYKKELHERYGLYYEKMRSKSDKEFWNRLMLLGVPFGRIKSKLAFYRIHHKSMLAMRNRNPGYDREITDMYNERLKAIKAGTWKEDTPWLESC